MRDGERLQSETPCSMAGMLALIWFAGLAVRVTILALPPVLPVVSSDLHLGRGDIGILTGLPPLLFATVALPGARVVARYGLRPTLVLGLLVNAIGAIARGFATGMSSLGAATAVMCLGVAVMQPAMPPLIRARAPMHLGLATAVYTNGLLVGETIPTVWVRWPSLPIVGSGWRAPLVLWALPVLATAIAIVLSRREPIATSAPTKTHQDWRSQEVWRSGLVLGGLAATYFGVNGFLPGYLVANDHRQLVQPSLVALNLAQIPSSFVMFFVAERLIRAPRAYGIAGAVLAVAVAIMVAAPGPATIVAAAFAGIACAVLLTLALALPTLLAEANDIPRFAGAMFTIGFGFAMAATMVAGYLSQETGIAAAALAPSAFTALLGAIAGLTLNFRHRGING